MEQLKDPKHDRKVNTVKPPPHKPLDAALLFPANNSRPDLKQMSRIGNC